MKKILIADDEPDVLKVLKFRVSKTGYEVIAAEDGTRAWELAREHRPDLAVLDYWMPGWNGVQVCQKMRADADLRKVPVIILSAGISALNPDLLAEVGANAAMAKPFDHGDLIRRIQEILDSSASQA